MHPQRLKVKGFLQKGHLIYYYYYYYHSLVQLLHIVNVTTTRNGMTWFPHRCLCGWFCLLTGKGTTNEVVFII